CLVYIGLTMVRAGHRQHPSGWNSCGYHEIQNPSTYRRTIDIGALMIALRIKDPYTLRITYRQWVDDALGRPGTGLNGGWPGALMADNRQPVKHFRTAQGARARQQRIETANAGHCLRDEPLCYNIRFEEESGA